MKRKTSLPKSIKKPTIKTETVGPKLNIHKLLDIKDRAILHPEEIQIGSFHASRETLDFILKEVSGNENPDDMGFLYGVKLDPDEKIPFGRIEVRDPKEKLLENITVVE